MKIQGKEFVIVAHDSGLALKRGAILVYSIQQLRGDGEVIHFARHENEWTDDPLLMCDCYAACELDEMIRRNMDK